MHTQMARGRDRAAETRKFLEEPNKIIRELKPLLSSRLKIRSGKIDDSFRLGVLILFSYLIRYFLLLFELLGNSFERSQRQV